MAAALAIWLVRHVEVPLQLDAVLFADPYAHEVHRVGDRRQRGAQVVADRRRHLAHRSEALAAQPGRRSGTRRSRTPRPS